MDTSIIVALIALVGSIGASVTTLVVNRLNRKDAQSDERKKQDDLVRTGVIVMLHDRLYQACRYYLNRGDIDEPGFDNVTALYNAYHALGGNSTGTRLYEAVKQLPIK